MKNGNKVKIVVVVVITVKMMMVIKMMVDKLMLNVDTSIAENTKTMDVVQQRKYWMV